MRLLFILILLVGCGGKGHAPKPPLNAEDRLKNQYDLYLSLIGGRQDQHGFINTNHCDSTLFSGLIGAAGADVDMTAAEVEEGKWLRRPTSYEECFGAGKSRSTISRDGLLGVMWWAYVHDRLDVLERMYAYGEANSWVMGEGRYGGVDSVMLPAYISLLAQLIERMGGQPHSVTSLFPESLADCEAYSCHIQTLRILLRNNVGDKELAVLKSTTEKYPENALFSAAYHRYTDGNYSEAIALLNHYYPVAKLPTSQELCEFWPMQQNGGDDNWEACPERNEVHSGGDFLFTAAVILDKLWMNKD